MPHQSLTGTSGVYFVASYLNAMGFQCAPTFGSVPCVDILASNIDGSALISLQIKTTINGLRQKGRGEQKKPHHYEWEIGWPSARLNVPNLLFILVDLKEFKTLPDVFILPSNIIAKYFEGGNPENWPRARYHELVETLEPYKNDKGWNILRNRLNSTS